MSRFAQPDLHPDADSLNAFAEQALPAAERARIMSHMAGCERCRQVVYLARTAAEAETPLVSSAAKAEPRRGWFAGAGKWRMAWIPAATLAAVAGVALWIQVRPTPPSPPLRATGCLRRPHPMKPQRPVRAPSQPILQSRRADPPSRLRFGRPGSQHRFLPPSPALPVPRWISICPPPPPPSGPNPPRAEVP